MTKLIATSVVRGAYQGESHGGVYLIDLKDEVVTQPIDWNKMDIDWQGRGWDRGLRGIAFNNDRVYIAASDELFVYTPEFKFVDSFRCQYLKHCHEICVFERRLFMTSTGYDAILGFDLDKRCFSWGLYIARDRIGFRGLPFNPQANQGPSPSNQLHINSITCTKKGMFFSGLRTDALIQYNGRSLSVYSSLPSGTHNATPYKGGVVFNHTTNDTVEYMSKYSQIGFHVPKYTADQLTHRDKSDAQIARQGFGRGLCIIDNDVIAGGSSPSTIALHNFKTKKTFKQVTLTQDIRNAIHGLEVWPYG